MRKKTFKFVRCIYTTGCSFRLRASVQSMNQNYIMFRVLYLTHILLTQFELLNNVLLIKRIEKPKLAKTFSVVCKSLQIDRVKRENCKTTPMRYRKLTSVSENMLKWVDDAQNSIALQICFSRKICKEHLRETNFLALKN